LLTYCYQQVSAAMPDAVEVAIAALECTSTRLGWWGRPVCDL
jgi:hypothetical protein